MATVPMLAGVGLMMVCCSSLSSFMMMGGEEKEDPVVPKTPAKKTPAKKTPEQIKADKAKAALALVKADPDATPAEVAAAQLEADNAAATVDATAGSSAAPYTESCDDLGGGILERTEADVDIDSCKQKCTDDLDCLGFIHGEEVGFCQLHDNKDPYGVDICDKGLKVYRDNTGKTPVYSESCDDLGGGILERHESGYNLTQCKTECNTDASCKGIIHKADANFCQLHDNNDPYGVDICDKGYKVFRK